MGGSEVSDANGFAGVLSDVVAKRQFPESVIVFANGRKSSYVDHPAQGEFIETHIVHELLPYVEKNYRAGGKQSLRYVAGFSMGGVGACGLSMRHPDLFAGAVAWGGSSGRSNQAIVSLRKAAASWRKSGFRLFLGIGERDQFAQADAFREALTAHNIAFRAKVLPGIGHDLGVYYSTAAEAFNFIGPNPLP
jgi:dienelactone hydrolase